MQAQRLAVIAVFSALVSVLALGLLSVLAHPATAQDSPIPERRLVLTKDVDFYGSDLQALFDTSYRDCETACLANPRCRAFTYNAKSRACFPKSQISDRKPFAGAWSAEVLDTAPRVLAGAGALAADLAFLGQGDFAAARQLALQAGGLYPANGRSADDLAREARARADRGDRLGAMRLYGAAISQQDSAAHWLAYSVQARLAAAQKNAKDRNTLRSRALSGAVNAYLRAPAVGVQVSALEEMARSLEPLRRGRDMIPALRLAETMQPRPEIIALLNSAIGKYGFRIIEHRVESDPASPRICARFSEELARRGVDYAPYVKAEGLVAEVSGRDLCLVGAEHGQEARVTFREGLPSASGEALARDVTLSVYVRDRAPQMRFPGRAYVLPRSADAALPIETVNAPRLELTLRRVSDRNLLRAMQQGYFAKPLSYWQERKFKTEIAQEIWRGEADIEGALNTDTLTRLPLGTALADQPPGIYVLSAALPQADPYDSPAASQWFVLSDLGLSVLSGHDGVHVFARGLGDAAPRAGVELRLVSRANEVLGQAVTDEQGHALFAPGLARGKGAAAPALVLAQQGDDMGFLSLLEPGFDLSDRGVEGRPPAPPVDTFLATDRGAYRAGEVIHATVLARDGQARAIPGLPLTAILTRPDGVEYSRHLSAEDKAGGHVFALPIGATAPRGTWDLSIKADPAGEVLASQTLLVEDFLPERIDVALTLPEAPVRLGDTPPLTLEARYLFGPPAPGLRIEGEVSLRPARDLEGWQGYRFGLAGEAPSPRSRGIDGGRTDAAGRASLALKLPQMQADRPLTMAATIRVAEGSGRPVERRITRPIMPDRPVIGIRPGFDGVLGEGAEAGFTLIALDPAGQPVTMPARWQLDRIETRYQWYQQNGRWKWEPVTRRSPVSRGEVLLGEMPLALNASVDWGEYELTVMATDGASGGMGAASSIRFRAGWFGSADAASSPDMLELALDKPAYAPGETARLRMVPRHGGVALVQVMSNRLITMKTLNVTPGEVLVDLPVTEEWGAGAYVTATVIRPMNESAGQNPARALGLAHAAVDPGAKRLSVSIEAPEATAPRGPVTVRVAVDGAAGKPAYVTLAAVDQGILNLTGFQTPDPASHYFGQRRLGMEMRDLYGRLIDGMNGAMGQVRSGGDAGAEMRMQSPPPTEDLAAFFHGPVMVGPDGMAELTLDLPDFNGALRLMALAWTPEALGSAEAEMLVRDPVVISASLPRFLAPGDSARMLLELVHTSGPAGEMGLSLTTSLPHDPLPQSVTLTEGGKLALPVPIRADTPGDHKLDLVLTLPDGRKLSKRLRLGVRRLDPPVSVTRRFSLGAGETFTLSDDLFADLHAGSGEAILTAGPLARIDAPRLLAMLDRYPYGCTEQVTSGAMPLLYLSSLSQAMGLGEGPKTRARIAQSIEKVLSRQAANGAFGLWRAGSGDFWLDAYVTDFLSRARAEGHSVPDRAYETALANLQNRVNYYPDFDQGANGGGTDLAYALMVLARAGRASMGDLRYFADEKGGDFGTPLAQAQLGAALAMYGEQQRSDAMFTRAAMALRPALTSLDTGPHWRDDYGTRLRDLAGVVALAAESRSQTINPEILLARMGGARRYSTQEASWALLAAHALVREPGVAGLELDGAPASGPVLRLTAAEASAPRAIRNSGPEPVELTLTTTGVPRIPAIDGGYGYTIERRYFTPQGEPVRDLSAITAGTRLVVLLRVTPHEAVGARLMINDPLPAGFEIDNPTLVSSGKTMGLDWLQTAPTRTAEFRAERFLAAVDWNGKQHFDLAYTVRAITPGQFHHPAATVEDMYRPQYRAHTETGAVTVLAE